MSRLLLTPPLIALFALGCGPKPTRHTAPPPTVDTARAMRDHFAQAQHAQRAIIAGNLPLARASAASIELISVPGRLGAWEPYLQRMRSGAKALRTTSSLAFAARALADIVVECGRCHKARGLNIAFTQTNRVPRPGFIGQMRKHQWAVERLWQGLVGPSDDRWRAGATELKTAPLVNKEPADQSEALINALRRRVRDLGERATDADDPFRRARIYAQLLSTCAVCHGLTRRR